MSGLGNLYKDDNDNLIFDGEEADPVFVSTSYPTYKLDPVVRKSQQDIDRLQKTLDNKKPIKKEEKKSSLGLQRIVPVLLLCVAASVIFGLYTWNQNLNNAPTVELMSIDENRLNKKPNADSQSTLSASDDVIQIRG